MPSVAATPDLRDKILTAAFHVLQNDGIRKFTQTAVAARAKIRQSHLTYYFPTRAELLEATAEKVLDGVTAHIAEAGEVMATWGSGHLLAELAKTMVNEPHMRMFLAMVVESDRDPAIRSLTARATERVHGAITAALGGAPGDARRARVIQVTIWGLGLYTFANRPTAEIDPADDTLNLLEEFAR